jgi:hypothetical protein
LRQLRFILACLELMDIILATFQMLLGILKMEDKTNLIEED